MDERTLRNLLRGVAEGHASVDDALARLRSLPFDALTDAMPDTHRELRTGFAEAVYGPGKTPEQVAGIVGSLTADGGGAVFVTRASAEQHAAVVRLAPEAEFIERAGLIVVRRSQEAPLGTVLVATAGTTDLPVADEAAAVADALAMKVDRLTDVGVAGLHRLLANRGALDAADAIIVVAGMEGALPSLVAGLTPGPVIAVPTSVGYGAAFDGLAALLGMLTACAPGIAVVNIDNGFGAAVFAHRLLRGRRGEG
ncbi:MAG: nickel pincer cofactor biosynthesis protein LarB [Actinobacteria bacterium]|nr:nickel pincer cofactor biosynthesis protein LarB [Actinomycetota bacterium]